MKQKEVIKELERRGFYLVRNGSGHKVYSNGVDTVIVPHSKTISSGVVHDIYKTLKKVV